MPLCILFILFEQQQWGGRKICRLLRESCSRRDIDYDWSEERELRQEGHRETGTNTNYRRVKTKVNGIPAVVTHKCIRSEKRE